MTNKYRGIKEGESSWICKPNNGGDLGDVFDIADELNRLAGQVETLESENAKLQERIRKLIEAGDGCEVWADMDSSRAWQRAKDNQ